MAIQIQGTTVIDDSRNLINAGLSGSITQGSSCSIKSYRNTLTLTGSATVKSTTIDCSIGNYFYLYDANTTYSISLNFSNVPSTGYVYTCLLHFRAGAYDQLSYPSTVSWPQNNTKPIIDYASTNLIFFTTVDGGSSWRAAMLNNYV